MSIRSSLSLYNLRAIIIVFSMIIALGACSKDKQSSVANPDLTITFSIAPDKPLVGNLLQFTADAEGAESDATYSWDFGDNTSSSLKNPTHTYEKPGNWVVKLTVKSGASEKAISREVIVSFANDIPSRMSLKEKLESLNGKILVCAHRADYQNAPENSLKSVSDAIVNGIDMVEIDIRQTKDGELVLMHDETINRTTNGSGKVSDYLLKDLRKYNLYKSNGTLTDQTIPTLKEVLELARGKIYIDLDIDQKAPFNKVYTLTNQYGMLKQSLFYSSEIKVIKEIFNLNNNEIIAMPIVRDEDDFTQLSGLNILVIQFNKTDELLKQKLQNKGWYIFRNAYVNTSNTPTKDGFSELNQVINIGGSIVQTDHPIEVKSKLQSQNLND